MTELEHNINHLPVIDRGESDVYRYDDTHVLKLYRGFDMKTIQTYQKVTNQVAEVMNGQQLVFELESPSLTVSLTCRVIPIDSVFAHPHGSPCAISEYIPGTQLFTKIQTGKFYAPGIPTDPIGKIASYDSELFYTTLEEKNRELRAQVRNPSIHLSSINMKIVENMCVITDITTDVKFIDIKPNVFGRFPSLFVE